MEPTTVIAVRTAANPLAEPVEFTVAGYCEAVAPIISMEVERWKRDDAAMHSPNISRDQQVPRIAVCLRQTTDIGVVKRSVTDAANQLKQALAHHGFRLADPVEREIVGKRPDYSQFAINDELG